MKGESYSSVPEIRLQISRKYQCYRLVFFSVACQATFELGILVGIAGFLAPMQVDISKKFLILMGFWWISDVILREGQNYSILFGRFHSNSIVRLKCELSNFSSGSLQSSRCPKSRYPCHFDVG